MSDKTSAFLAFLFGLLLGLMIGADVGYKLAVDDMKGAIKDGLKNMFKPPWRK